MNHDSELQILGLMLKVVLAKYDAEISMVNTKHRTELIKEFEKAQHYMVKMTKIFDDLNEWFSAFGSPEEKQ